MRVAKRVAYLRAASGITQEDLASRLGIALKNLQRIESGRQNLTLGSVERLAGALQVDVRELFAAPTAERPARASASTKRLEGLAGPGRVVFRADDLSRPQSAVPVVSLHAAVVRLAAGRTVEALAWLNFTRSHVPSGAFVARVLGTSMEPTIHDGAWVVFVPPAPGPLFNRVVLIARTSEHSPRFLIARVVALAAARDRARRIVLRSDNPAFAAMTTEVHSLAALHLVGKLRRTLK